MTDLSVLTEDTNQEMLAEVLAGLRSSPKTLPCKYFYDEKGSQLFNQICELPEYYQTRTEEQIMLDYQKEIADVLGENVCLIEFGSGSCKKIKSLLSTLRNFHSYITIDISGEHLRKSVEELAQEFPEIQITPIVADYTKPFEVSILDPTAGRKVVYFPGSTIGNFDPDEATQFLSMMKNCAGDGGAVLIGVDLLKETEALEAAYNDAQRITAQFNLNILSHINHRCGANFNLADFSHYAPLNREQSRIEMHLISKKDQEVAIGEETIHLEEGEMIQTESSYKYSLQSFNDLALRAGLIVSHVWTDDEKFFSIQLLSSNAS